MPPLNDFDKWWGKSYFLYIQLVAMVLTAAFCCIYTIVPEF